MTFYPSDKVRPLALAVSLTALSACAASAPVGQGAIPPFEQVPKGDPSFFVTSRGLEGGNLGGLGGADAHCAQLAAEAALPGRQWRAYLSTQATPSARAIHARERIGKGPWFNLERIRIARDLAHLHGDNAELARAGNLVSQGSALTERGERIGGKGDPVLRHDILTGSTDDGRAYPDNRFDRTCRNWTYSGAEGSAQIGHSDRDTIGLSISWNSAHQTTGCSLTDLKKTGGDGLFYCFAADPVPNAAELRK
ncbi:hypothetical protein ACWPM1_12150 [Tsuneonella sp. HG249]